VTITADSSLPIPRVELLRRLRQVLPSDSIVEEPESQRPFECDALMIYRELPLLVILPATVAQVQDVLRICHQLNVPVVARGSGTGLCAGAMPHPEGVLLGLSKLDRIMDIDPLARTARVQSGVSNLSISDAAARYGLYYAPDPSSQIACSIGGNVAENAGGVHCLKYGLTVHNILSLELLTVEGERLTVGSMGLDSPGYDLMALLTGAEGLLGVVTEVTVRLLPSPELAHVVMAGYPRDAEAVLLCEVDGTREEVTGHTAKVATLFKELGASSLKISQNEAERALLWKGRKSAFPAVGRLAPDYLCMDGTIPRSQVSVVLNEISRLSREYNLRVANVFHAGDGNLHPLILYDASDPREVRKAEEFGGKILELSVRVGGCITGEHGVSLEKLRQMPSQFSAAELLQFEEIKHAFDPALTLNPGKGVPILKRCQEYRALPARHQHD